MVKSLNPRDNDYRTEPGREYDNATIGEKMLAALAVSLEAREDEATDARTRPAEAAMALLAAARRRAKRKGMTVKAVLREHMEALSHNAEMRTRHLRTVQDDHRSRVLENAQVQHEMDRQDDRRVTQRFTETTMHAARLVDAIEASRMLVPHQTAVIAADGMTVDRPELATHAVPGSVLALPAPRHPMGGQNPNADLQRALRPPQALPEDGPALLMPPPRQPIPRALKHSPDGGMHDPIALDSDESSTRAERMIAHLEHALQPPHARGHRL